MGSSPIWDASVFLFVCFVVLVLCVILGFVAAVVVDQAKKIFAPRLELGTSRVLGERHDQLDHANRVVEYLGFDPSTSSLLRTHASNCANTPQVHTTPRGFEPLRSKTTHLAGEPLNHSGKVSFPMDAISLGIESLAQSNKEKGNKMKKKENPPCRGIEPRASA